MKKILCIILSAVLILAFAACGKTPDTETTDASQTTTESTSETTESTETTEAPTETATEAPTTTTTEAPTTQAPTTTTTQAPKNVSLDEVKSEVLKAAGVSGQMDIGTDRIAELYGIKAADVAQSAGFITVTGAFPEEAVMIQAKDDAAKSRIVKLLQARLDDVKNQSESYDPDSYALVQKCKVITSGDYVALFLAAGHTQMESAFESAVK